MNPGVQSVVHRYASTLSMWHDCLTTEPPPPPPPPSSSTPYSNAWRRLLSEEGSAVLLGWPLVDNTPEVHHPRWQWRPAGNPYHPVAGVTDAWERLLLAAVAETVRWLGTPAEAAAALDITEAEWCDYRRETVAEHGLWCDMESVATRFCAWAPPEDEEQWRAWRQPLARAEGVLRPGASPR